MYKALGGVLVFGEIILDIYVKLAQNATFRTQSAAVADIDFELGGNTWNIASTLVKLGRSVSFICTSSKDDLSSGLFKERAEVTYPYVEYIPGLISPAPRYVAVDDGSIPVLRAIDIREKNKPKEQQLKYVSELLHRYRAQGFRVAILSSSIEADFMEHIVRECIKLKFEIVGTVGSAPTVHQLIPHLKDIALLILNLSEAQTLTSELKIACNDPHYLARGLLEYAPRVIVTRGGECLYAVSKDGVEISYTPPSLGERFVNDLGAGDTFVSFLVDAYMRHQKWISSETIGWAITGATMVCQIRNHLIDYVDLSYALDLYNSIIQMNTNSHP